MRVNTFYLQFYLMQFSHMETCVSFMTQNFSFWWIRVSTRRILIWKGVSIMLWIKKLSEFLCPHSNVKNQLTLFHRGWVSCNTILHIIWWVTGEPVKTYFTEYFKGKSLLQVLFIIVSLFSKWPYFNKFQGFECSDFKLYVLQVKFSS